MLSTITSVSVDNICVNTPASLIKQKGNKICHKTRLFEITSLVQGQKFIKHAPCSGPYNSISKLNGIRLESTF